MFLPKNFLKNKFHRNSNTLTHKKQTLYNGTRAVPSKKKFNKLFLENFSKRVANLVKLTLQIHIFPKTFPIFCPRKDKISGKKITEGDQLEQLQK